MALQQPPNRDAPYCRARVAQRSLDRIERNIRGLGNQRQDLRAVGFGLMRAPVATHRFAAILPVARHSRDILLTELGLTS